MTQVFHTIAEFRAALADRVRGARDGVVGLVPTMGALHSGHGALLEAARAEADILIASVFVNPLQFDDDADYHRYPQPLAQDLALLSDHGTDLVFVPDIEQMYPGYPESPQVRVSAGEMGRLWEGSARPGHFDGVATVVAKLFSIAAPGPDARLHAWFGEKDAEQLAIIARMRSDLNLQVGIRSVPIVRDENGLALSSRNQRLSGVEYHAGLHLPRALFALRDRTQNHQPLGLPELRAQLAAAAGVTLDYLAVVDPHTLRELHLPGDQELTEPALALAAIRVGHGPGTVRLIDNIHLTPGR